MVALANHNINIAMLQNVYNKSVSNGKLKIADVSQQTFANIIGSLTVDWRSYTLNTYPDSTQIIEFSIPDDTTLVVPGSLTAHDTVKYHSKTSAVFIMRKDTINTGFFMKTIEDCTAPGYQSVISSLQYNQEPPTFNGNILYFTFGRQFINGFQWQNGVPVKTLSLGTTSSQGQTQANKSGKLKINKVTVSNCTTEVYGVYNVTEDQDGNITSWQNQIGTITITTCTITDDGTSGGGGPAASSSVGGVNGAPTPPKPLPCVPASTASVSSVHGHLTVNVVQGGSGGAGGNTNSGGGSPCVVPVKITDNVINPCVRKMVEAAIAKNIQYNLQKSMNGIFNTNTNFNLNFNDDQRNLIDHTADGETTPTHITSYIQPGTNRTIITGMDLDITLNSTILSGSSQEFISATILHEALHAYFRTIGTLDEHNVMVNQYIPWFESSLKSIYPNLPDSDLEALAFGGLTQSIAITIPLYSSQKNILDLINQSFKTGGKGTPCTH